MLLNKQQVNTILTNAPVGTDKKKLLDGLILRGYDLEGVDSNVIRQSLQPKPVQPTTTEPSLTEKVGADINTRVGRVGNILANKDTGIVEKGVQVFGQGAGMAANALEQTAMEIPGVKQAAGVVGAGINWLATSKWSPFKYIGNEIGKSKALIEVTKLYDTDQSFKDSVDAVANIARLGGDVQAVVDGANFATNVTNKITTAVKSSEVIPNITAGASEAATAIKNVANKAITTTKEVLGGRDTKLLSIFSGEQTPVIESAMKFPKEADLGIHNGDVALRNAVQIGAESSIKAKQSFTQAYGEAFKKLVKDNPQKISSNQEILYKFADDLTAQKVKIKNGNLDFSTSNIMANPGEVSKITNAYRAIQGWTDFSVQGVNELKQFVGKLTKFANEAGGSSKSPFLGQFYHWLDTKIEFSLPEASKVAYKEMNQKFTDTIGLYDDMVEAFNSGDPFTKLSQLFGANKDTLRQVIDFYEQTTGNKIAPIVAGRTLAAEKTAAFGFLNPRSWVDFFIPPKLQAEIVTGYGKVKNQALLKSDLKSNPIESGNTTNPTQIPNTINKTIIPPIIPKPKPKVKPKK